MARPGATTRLDELVATSGVVSGAMARERTLTLLEVFDSLLPHGLQRGSVVGCEGPAAVSLALALAAGPSRQGAWVGVAGLPALGVAAAEEAGVALERLVLVVEPRVDGRPSWRDEQWGDVLAAMVDGFDVLLLGPGVAGARPATLRRVLARLQARGAVAVVAGAPSVPADLRLRAEGVVWSGLGEGYGVARDRRVEVTLDGRRVPRARRAEWWLPAADGRVRPVGSVEAGDGAPVVPLRRTG